MGKRIESARASSYVLFFISLRVKGIVDLRKDGVDDVDSASLVGYVDGGPYIRAKNLEFYICRVLICSRYVAFLCRAVEFKINGEKRWREGGGGI